LKFNLKLKLKNLIIISFTTVIPLFRVAGSENIEEHYANNAQKRAANPGVTVMKIIQWTHEIIPAYKKRTIEEDDTKDRGEYVMHWTVGRN